MKFCESCNQHYYDGTDTCPVCGTVLEYYENEQINVEKQIDFKRQSIKSCFTKKGLFSWTGRRNRKPYLVVMVIISIICSISQIILHYLNDFALNNVILSFSLIGCNLFLNLFYWYIWIMNTIKRGHDLNLSAKWSVIYPHLYLFCILIATIILVFVINIPFIKQPPQFIILGLIVMFVIWELILNIYLLFFKGTIGNNKYGPDPLQKTEE